MEQRELTVVLRNEAGKEAAKRLRNKGFVPGIVYHRGTKSIPVAVVSREITSLIHAVGGGQTLISLKIEKDKNPKGRTVIIKEIQQHPVRKHILHVDFNEISMTEKITVEVEIIGKGEPVGVKQSGGVLDHTLRQIKIECLPADIPNHIDVDVSELKLDDSVHVRDLKLSDKIKVLTDPDVLLFQVKLHEEKVEETPAAATGETPELEVIREKKEEPGLPGRQAGAAPTAKGKEEPKAKEEKK